MQWAPARMIALTTMMALSACGLHPQPSRDARIVLPGEFNGAGIGILNTKPSQAYTNGDLVLCLDRPGHVTIRRIDMIRPYGGLKLDAFTVIPNDMERGKFGFADDNKKIVDYGLDTNGPAILTMQCPDFASLVPNPSIAPRSVALVLEFSKSTTEDAGDAGIEITYVSGTGQYTLSVAWTVTLCAGDSWERCRSAAAASPSGVSG